MRECYVECLQPTDLTLHRQTNFLVEKKTAIKPSSIYRPRRGMAAVCKRRLALRKRCRTACLKVRGGVLRINASRHVGPKSPQYCINPKLKYLVGGDRIEVKGEAF